MTATSSSTSQPVAPDVAYRTKVFGRSYRLPRTRLRRQMLGWAFVGGGVFSFLPILGAWMLPVGFVILSVDSPRLRRSRRRMTVKIARRWPRLNAMIAPKSA